MDTLPAEVLAKIQAQKEKLQKEFEEYAAKQREAKLADVCTATGVSQEEAGCALSLCENDELEAINRLATEPSFKLKVQEMAKGTNDHFAGEESIGGTLTRRGPGGEIDYDSFESESDDDDEAARRRKRKRKVGKTKPAHAERTEKLDRVDKGPRQHIEGFNTDGTPRAPTIRLGDALKRLEEIRKANEAAIKNSSSPSKTKRASPRRKAESEEEKTDAVSSTSSTEPSPPRKSATKPKTSPTTTAVTAKVSTVAAQRCVQQQHAAKAEDDYTYEDLKSLEWSDARIKAFLGRKNNPNAYYYRFNAVGEDQRTGAWTDEEHQNFMDLIKDGVDYHWGIFSMKTPGRVGYQCSNYYRKLIADGVVVDPNYEVDDKGKLTFKRGIKRFRPGTSEDEIGEAGATQPTITEVKRKNKPTSGSSKSSKRRKRNADDESDEEGAYDEEEEEDGVEGREYLLGDMQDVMTLKRMKMPAISPFGHVLDYSTWLRLLKQAPTNTCPFTKQRVTRRDLIKLTKENLEQYRPKILVLKFDPLANMLQNNVTATSTSDDSACEDAQLSI